MNTLPRQNPDQNPVAHIYHIVSEYQTMVRKSILLLLCLIFFLLGLHLSLPTTGEGKQHQAVIKELTATSSETHLIFFAQLENELTPEMLEILHSGIPLQFIFFVELYKITEQWPEEQITATTFYHAIAYDTLKESYQVTLEENNNKIYTFKALSEAQHKLNEVNGAKVVPLKQLVPDNRYKLRIKTEFQRQTLPGSLESVFPFFSKKDFKTDWHWIELIY